MKMSDSCAAVPDEPGLGGEIEEARRRLAALETELARRRTIEDELVHGARAEVADLEAAQVLSRAKSK